MPDLSVATFAVPATPPRGHGLCGGWITPVVGVDDPLWLRGLILLGSGRPIVVATLDWTGVLNESHERIVDRLAKAAGTDPERVLVHCVHQHNAPFVDHRANARVAEAGGTPLFIPSFFDDLLDRGAAAAGEALKAPRAVSSIGHGTAEVAEVASNRRVIGPNGKIQFSRTSATKDPVARAAPEGTIDPTLSCLTLSGPAGPVARLSFYTTHPMSYYGDGRVSADFPGLARYRREISEPGVFRLYLTGCAGNVTAGKYNDGSKVRRAELADRLEAAMIASDAAADERAGAISADPELTVRPFTFSPRADLDPEKLRAIVRDPKATTADRNRSAMAASWLERIGRPIRLASLALNKNAILSLPGETFVEYQLAAKKANPDWNLCVAAYGDGGPWYIPLARSFEEGGYEPSVAFVARDSEPAYQEAISSLVRR